MTFFVATRRLLSLLHRRIYPHLLNLEKSFENWRNHWWICLWPGSLLWHKLIKFKKIILPRSDGNDADNKWIWRVPMRVCKCYSDSIVFFVKWNIFALEIYIEFDSSTSCKILELCRKMIKETVYSVNAHQSTCASRRISFCLLMKFARSGNWCRNLIYFYVYLVLERQFGWWHTFIVIAFLDKSHVNWCICGMIGHSE